MDYVKAFEEPLPVIDRSEDKIYIEASSSCTGRFTVKNRGQGQIKGRVVSSSPKMTFSPEYFNGNDTSIEFNIDLESLKPGDEFFSKCIVISNGGEHIIDFHVKIIQYALETKEGVRLTSLRDFMAYSNEYPKSAAVLFSSHEFLIWLGAVGYEFMEMAEKFAKDSNAHRAVDNFLIFNKLKKKAELAVSKKEISIVFKPTDREIFRGSIEIKMQGRGYVEEFISSINTSPWLRIEKEKILWSDFENGETFQLNFSVNPMFLEKRISHGKIFIGEVVINIKIIKEPLLKVRAERAYYDFQDKGKIIFENYTGGKLPVDIIPKDTAIKLEGERFIIGRHAEIPFEISVAPIYLAQMNLKKQAVIHTAIEIESVLKTGNFKKEIDITIGNFL